MMRDFLLKLLFLPRPPEEELPRGVTEESLDAFTARTGLSIPSEMREWLKISNGPCVGPGGMFGIKPAREDLDIEGVFALYPSWRSRGWIPLAGDGCGNYYVVLAASEGTPVGFVEVTCDQDAIARVVAPTVFAFLDALFDKELGKKRPLDDGREFVGDPRVFYDFEGGSAEDDGTAWKFDDSFRAHQVRDLTVHLLQDDLRVVLVGCEILVDSTIAAEIAAIEPALSTAMRRARVIGPQPEMARRPDMVQLVGLERLPLAERSIRRESAGAVRLARPFVLRGAWRAGLPAVCEIEENGLTIVSTALAELLVSRQPGLRATPIPFDES